jgi:hypothetical protein
MYRVLETIRTGEIEKSRRVLPFAFAERQEAVDYIRQLQLMFLYHGFGMDHWWAKQGDTLELYRWELVQQ